MEGWKKHLSKEEIPSWGETTNSENDYKKPGVAKLREGGGCAIRKVSKVFD